MEVSSPRKRGLTADVHDASLVTQIQYPDGDTSDDNVKFAYDLDGRAHTRTAQKASGETANVITYDYDTTFRRLSAERVTTPGTGVDQTVLSISRKYDSLGRPEFITSHSDADPDLSSSFADAVNQVQYTYNAFGALDKEYQEHEGKVDGSSLHVDYAYDDDAGNSYRGLDSVFTKGMRPKSIKYPNGRLVHYTYGTGGGHTTTMRKATSSSRGTGILVRGPKGLPVSLPAVASAKAGLRAVTALPWLGKPMGKMPVELMGKMPMPRFDARGNMSTAPKPSGMTATYACIYDAWNRLVDVYVDTNQNGVLDSGESVATYRYDGTGRRIRKYVPDGEDWTVSEFYYNAGWQLLETRKAGGVERTGSPLAEPSAVTAVYEQYVWSQRYIDAPILRDRDSDGDGDLDDGDLGKTDSGLDERLYYCTDAQMNVTALVTAAGTVVERYAYDPYGQPIFYDGSWGTQSSSSYGNAILYAGYYYDAETGFYHVRNRMYHAQLGRWLQRDLLGYVDGMSVYEYCGSGPMTGVDPLGYFEWDTGTFVGTTIAAGGAGAAGGLIVGGMAPPLPVIGALPGWAFGGLAGLASGAVGYAGSWAISNIWDWAWGNSAPPLPPIPGTLPSGGPVCPPGTATPPPQAPGATPGTQQAPPQTERRKQYTVKSGDTLSEIMQKHGDSYYNEADRKKWADVNPTITNPDKLKVGQQINVPAR